MVVMIRLVAELDSRLKDAASACWKHVKNFMFFIEGIFWKSKKFLWRLVQSKN
jgi:hypothetical protein|tara:strand:+ start:151 stop:309 length:159 start_codon:yes stop_codon:yes gene_type:complete